MQNPLAVIPAEGSMKDEHGSDLLTAIMTAKAVVMVDVSQSMFEDDTPVDLNQHDETDWPMISDLIARGGYIDGTPVIRRVHMANIQTRILQKRFKGEIAVCTFGSDVKFVAEGVIPADYDRLFPETRLDLALDFLKQFSQTGIKMFVITDGMPTSSVAMPATLQRTCLNIAKDFGDVINFIFVGKPYDEDVVAFMSDLAKTCGGKSETISPAQIAATVTETLMLSAPGEPA